MQEAACHLGATWRESAVETTRLRVAELGTQRLKGILSLSPRAFSLLGISLVKPGFPAWQALCFRP